MVILVLRWWISSFPEGYPPFIPWIYPPRMHSCQRFIKRDSRSQKNNGNNPGRDSSRDLYIPQLEVTYPLKESRFHHPKKVTFAELPGRWNSKKSSLVTRAPDLQIYGSTTSFLHEGLHFFMKGGDWNSLCGGGTSQRLPDWDPSGGDPDSAVFRDSSCVFFDSSCATNRQLYSNIYIYIYIYIYMYINIGIHIRKER